MRPKWGSGAFRRIELTSAQFLQFVIHGDVLPTRTSEPTGHLQIYDSRAAFRFGVPGADGVTNRLGFAGISFRAALRREAVLSDKPGASHGFIRTPAPGRMPRGLCRTGFAVAPENLRARTRLLRLVRVHAADRHSEFLHCLCVAA